MNHEKNRLEGNSSSQSLAQSKTSNLGQAAQSFVPWVLKFSRDGDAIISLRDTKLLSRN